MMHKNQYAVTSKQGNSLKKLKVSFLMMRLKRKERSRWSSTMRSSSTLKMILVKMRRVKMRVMEKTLLLTLLILKNTWEEWGMRCYEMTIYQAVLKISLGSVAMPSILMMRSRYYLFQIQTLSMTLLIKFDDLRWD